MDDLTILVVDDEPTNLAALHAALTPRYRVRVARSGPRALAVAATEPRPDLVLLDVMMPQMDGYAVLARLKAEPATADVPVIFVTAMEGEADEERGLGLGAVDYVTKPFKPAVLLARIKTHLELKRFSDILRDQNACLEGEVARRLVENLVFQDVSIRALAHLAETRDPETGEHILRTQAYVQALARRLQPHPRFRDVITDQYIEMLTKSAPLHDIGKVGIPDNVLLKPGRLTEAERQLMQRHTVLGAQAIERAERDVAQSVPFLTLAKEIAHWHHERWDGRGYPDGLAGEAIPVSARLMALADTFDAIVTWRVYQAPRSLGEGRDIIRAERGRQFDPDVVDGFLCAFDEFAEIARRHRSEGAAGATLENVGSAVPR